MQRLYCPITPQKRTLPAFTEDCPLRELSPFNHHHLLPSHRKNNKLELLHSPTPLHNDLFAQLLASAAKVAHESFPPEGEVMEEEGELECLEMEESEDMEDMEESGELGEIDEESDTEGIKKRKRKSTAQIKVLKQEL
jgi:hypothetical protein